MKKKLNTNTITNTTLLLYPVISSLRDLVSDSCKYVYNIFSKKMMK